MPNIRSAASAVLGGLVMLAPMEHPTIGAALYAVLFMGGLCVCAILAIRAAIRARDGEEA